MGAQASDSINASNCAQHSIATSFAVARSGFAKSRLRSRLRISKTLTASVLPKYFFVHNYYC